MDFLLYGAYGYTGTLIAEHAAAQGLRPLLAGRDPERLRALADRLSLPHRAFALSDTEALAAVLAEVPVVLHAAGPFAHTAAPMVEACLATRTPYLDVTGEIEVFEALAARDAEAQAAGIMVMPGVGFDVVPSDCLAAHLKQRLPEATHLELALHGVGGISHGTATTMVENLGQGGAIRRDGVITRVADGYRSRTVDFGRGPRTVVSIPWGDVSTAFYTTGIPNIIVYTAMPAPMRRMLPVMRVLGGVLRLGPVQGLLKGMVDRRPAGPDAEARTRGASYIWGEASDRRTQRKVRALLRGPEGYTLTAMAALEVAQRVREGHAPAGFQTPAGAYGADLVLALDGVSRQDVPVADVA